MMQRQSGRKTIEVMKQMFFFSIWITQYKMAKNISAYLLMIKQLIHMTYTYKTYNILSLKVFSVCLPAVVILLTENFSA